MRLWSLHPILLDSKGLVALWREALLAQNVLLGKTKGYKNHPQLERFKNTENPLDSISSYLIGIWAEATKRHYNFSYNKIYNLNALKYQNLKIPVSSEQIKYEFEHLQKKLKYRDPDMYSANRIFDTYPMTKIHHLFYIVEGPIEYWEKPIEQYMETN